jgi:hypothetical protein
MALFPLALPIIALTAIAAIPFVLVALAAGLVTATVAVPIRLLRRLGRQFTRPGPERISGRPARGRPVRRHAARSTVLAARVGNIERRT